MVRLRPCFPKSYGVPRVEDRRVPNGIISFNRNGLRWCDAPGEYAPARTLYHRWKRWSDMGVFAPIGGRLTGRTKGGRNPKLHAVADTTGRPIRLFLTEGQGSDYTGARALVSSLPAVDRLLGDRGYDVDWFP